MAYSTKWLQFCLLELTIECTCSRYKPQGTVRWNAPTSVCSCTTLSERTRQMQVVWFFFPAHTLTWTNKIHKSNTLRALPSDVPVWISSWVRWQSVGEWKQWVRPFKWPIIWIHWFLFFFGPLRTISVGNSAFAYSADVPPSSKTFSTYCTWRGRYVWAEWYRQVIWVKTGTKTLKSPGVREKDHCFN